MFGRIIRWAVTWQYTYGFGLPIPMSWRPVFAEPPASKIRYPRRQRVSDRNEYIRWVMRQRISE